MPARRFARAQPWPKEAETLWTCEIAWKAGYLKSNFRAMAAPPGSGRRKSIAESPSLRWTLMTDPEPPTPEMIASVKILVSALVAAGWERTGSGRRVVRAAVRLARQRRAGSGRGSGRDRVR